MPTQPPPAPPLPPAPATRSLSSVAAMLGQVTVERDGLPGGTAVGSFVLREVVERSEFGLLYRAGSSASGGEVLIEEYWPTALAQRSPNGELAPRDQSLTKLYTTGLEAFVAEAELLARLQHPALVRIGPVWRLRGTAYRLRYEQNGRLLSEHLEPAAEPPAEPWLRALTEPMLGALEVLHRADKVHGHVRPDNILVQPDGAPTLLDLSAARSAVSRAAPWLVAPIEPGFQAPETALYGVTLTPAADVYSLAAVLYSCLLGEPPKPLRSVGDPAGGRPSLAAQVAELRQRQTVPDYGLAWMATIDSALAFDPAQRPATAQAFRDALAQAAARDADPMPTWGRQGASAAGPSASVSPPISSPVGTPAPMVAGVPFAVVAKAAPVSTVTGTATETAMPAFDASPSVATGPVRAAARVGSVAGRATGAAPATGPAPTAPQPASADRAAVSGPAPFGDAPRSSRPMPLHNEPPARAAPMFADAPPRAAARDSRAEPGLGGPGFAPASASGRSAPGALDEVPLLIIEDEAPEDLWHMPLDEPPPAAARPPAQAPGFVASRPQAPEPTLQTPPAWSLPKTNPAVVGAAASSAKPPLKPRPWPWPWVLAGVVIGAIGMLVVNLGIGRLADDARLAHLMVVATKSPAGLGTADPAASAVAGPETTVPAAGATAPNQGTANANGQPGGAGAPPANPARSSVAAGAGAAVSGGPDANANPNPAPRPERTPPAAVADGILTEGPAPRAGGGGVGGVEPTDPARGTAPAANAPGTVAPAQAPSAAAPAAPAAPAPQRRQASPQTDPNAACAPRTNFALYQCVKTQCQQPAYYAHPTCVVLRRTDELPAATEPGAAVE